MNTNDSEQTGIEIAKSVKGFLHELIIQTFWNATRWCKEHKIAAAIIGLVILLFLIG